MSESTQEQKTHGLSVDNQIDSLKKYANENGYEIYSIYNDAGISARKSYKKRPDLLRMLDDCQDKKIDLVLFTRLDRFFRSVPDYYSCIERMNGVPWRAIWEDYETETSSGVFKVNIMLSIAQSEADRTSEKIKSVLDYKKEQGLYVGRAPWGYLLKNGKLIKDEECSYQVRKTFELYLESLNFVYVAKKTQELGFYVPRRRIVNMLQNPTYRGIALNTECEPYITPEEAKIIDETHKRRHRTPSKKGRFYPYSGLLECPFCGNNLASTTRTDKPTETRKEYIKVTYACYGVGRIPHKTFSMAQSTIDKAVLGSLDQELMRFNSDIVLQDKKSDNDAKRKKIEAKLDRLKILFEEGDIELEDYKEKRDDLKNELFKLPTEKKRKPIQLPHDWRNQYDLLDMEHQQIFMRRIIRRIYVTPEKKLHHIDFI